MSQQTPGIRIGATTRDFIEWVQNILRDPRRTALQSINDALKFCNESLNALVHEDPDCEHDINALMEASRGLHDEVAGYKARVEKLREALEKIAKPALGGKLQQYIAQAALEADESLKS